MPLSAVHACKNADCTAMQCCCTPGLLAAVKVCAHVRRERRKAGDELEVTRLAEGAAIELRARARNDRGVSAWSEPLRVQTRRKAVDGGGCAGAFKWTQTKADVTLQIAVRPCSYVCALTSFCV